MPSLRAVGGLCLEVSLGTWDFDPVLHDFFPIGNDLFWIAHVPSETPRHRPPTALKLASEDSTLSGAYTLQVWS